MYILSPASTETITCAYCGRIQFLTFSNLCRACRRPLGFDYAVVPFTKRVLQSAPPQRYLAQEFGQVVQAIRLQNGLTRNQLAALTRRHVSFFSRIERGVIIPNLATVALMLRSMEIDRIIFRVWPGKR